MADPRSLSRRDVPDWPVWKWVRWRYCWWLPRPTELREAYWDVLAYVNGWCNNCPRSRPADETRGGYQHWRCQLADRHLGLHRFHNYVWSAAPGQVRYEPLTRDWHTDQWMKSPYARRHVGGTWLQRMRYMRREQVSSR